VFDGVLTGLYSEASETEIIVGGGIPEECEDEWAAFLAAKKKRYRSGLDLLRYERAKENFFKCYNEYGPPIISA
jgi:hypothetical protein